MHQLPETGYLRLNQIIGNPNADPPIPAVIPVGKSAWWAGVKAGKYPAPVKLGPRTTAWRVQDIRDLVNKGPSPENGERELAPAEAKPGTKKRRVAEVRKE